MLCGIMQIIINHSMLSTAKTTMHDARFTASAACIDSC